MREPPASRHVFGILAEFASGEDLVEGVRKARAEGFTQIDAYTPFPIDELTEALDIRDSRVAWLTLFGGMAGAALGYGFQVYTNHAYAIPIGNRPLVSPQAFLLITFEMMVLAAVLSGILGMLLLNRLPRLNHPVFDAKGFGFGAENKFFLIVFSDDEQFGETETGAFFRDVGAKGVQIVRGSEQPA